MVAKGATRQGNYQAAEYLYPRGPKHPYTWRDCPACGERALVKVHGKGFCSRRCSKRTGDAVGYHGAHIRLRNERGRAAEHTCPCGKPARDWAFDEPTGYSTDLSRYTARCVSCHRRLDQQEGGE